MRLTKRDQEILQKLERCKWLTTTQIQRLFFPNAGLDPVRKRLRKLADAKHLRSYQRHHMSEMLHGLGKPPKVGAVVPLIPCTSHNRFGAPIIRLYGKSLKTG